MDNNQTTRERFMGNQAKNLKQQQFVKEKRGRIEIRSFKSRINLQLMLLFKKPIKKARNNVFKLKDRIDFIQEAFMESLKKILIRETTRAQALKELFSVKSLKLD